MGQRKLRRTALAASLLALSGVGTTTAAAKSTVAIPPLRSGGTAVRPGSALDCTLYLGESCDGRLRSIKAIVNPTPSRFAKEVRSLRAKVRADPTSRANRELAGALLAQSLSLAPEWAGRRGGKPTAVAAIREAADVFDHMGERATANDLRLFADDYAVGQFDASLMSIVPGVDNALNAAAKIGITWNSVPSLTSHLSI